MKNYFKKNWRVVFLATLVGCAGFNRSCSSECASAVGTNWLIVQYNYVGTPLACWKLSDESVANEHNSDGIYWQQAGHLVHISGWYNRVQVEGGNFEGAAGLLGIELDRCQNGTYAFSFVPTVGQTVDVRWKGKWYRAHVLREPSLAKWEVSYEGYGPEMNEIVGVDRLREAAVTAESK